MQNIGSFWLFPLIIVAGILQAFGPPMNGALKNALVNPWLASLVSFLPVVAFLTCLALCLPRPLPTSTDLSSMPWWAPLGGISKGEWLVDLQNQKSDYEQKYEDDPDQKVRKRNVRTFFFTADHRPAQLFSGS